MLSPRKWQAESACSAFFGVAKLPLGLEELRLRLTYRRIAVRGDSRWVPTKPKLAYTHEEGALWWKTRSEFFLSPGRPVIVLLSGGTPILFFDQPSKNRAFTVGSIASIGCKAGVSSNEAMQAALSTKEIVIGAGLGLSDAKPGSLGDEWKTFHRENWQNDNPKYRGVPGRFQFAVAREDLLQIEPSAEAVVINAVKALAALAVTAASGGWGAVYGLGVEGAFEVYSSRHDLRDAVFSPGRPDGDASNIKGLAGADRERMIQYLEGQGFTILGATKTSIIVEALIWGG